MMYIKAFLNMRKSEKVHRFGEILHLPEMEAAGVLIYFLQEVAAQTDGAGVMTAGQFAMAAQCVWSGRLSQFQTALHKSGFLVKDKNGSFCISNFNNMVGSTDEFKIKQRFKWREAKRKQRIAEQKGFQVREPHFESEYGPDQPSKKTRRKRRPKGYRIPGFDHLPQKNKDFVLPF